MIVKDVFNLSLFDLSRVTAKIPDNPDHKETLDLDIDNQPLDQARS